MFWFFIEVQFLTNYFLSDDIVIDHSIYNKFHQNRTGCGGFLRRLQISVQVVIPVSFSQKYQKYAAENAG